jgi:hypothetical protein
VIFNVWAIVLLGVSALLVPATLPLADRCYAWREGFRYGAASLWPAAPIFYHREHRMATGIQYPVSLTNALRRISTDPTPSREPRRLFNAVPRGFNALKKFFKPYIWGLLDNPRCTSCVGDEEFTTKFTKGTKIPDFGLWTLDFGLQSVPHPCLGIATKEHKEHKEKFRFLSSLRSFAAIPHPCSIRVSSVAKREVLA